MHQSLGVNSFKLFLSHPGRLMLQNQELLGRHIIYIFTIFLLYFRYLFVFPLM
jgi:hypothetical protein